MIHLKTQQPDKENQPTEINDIVFGIAASAKLWKQRKNYIKLWYKPKSMRRIVWLDREVEDKNPEDIGLRRLKSLATRPSPTRTNRATGPRFEYPVS
ncbi:hypothetical protein DVH24_011058 [Malus domestica]|uniref:Uncharacterized protein n=1 Tax=Malus domestica TaxID=3750 RepID=A0A498JXP0_MALDO|nr:hypothetical protein DVH24_011058 [Malus domestica]